MRIINANDTAALVQYINAVCRRGTIKCIQVSQKQLPSRHIDNFYVAASVQILTVTQ